MIGKVTPGRHAVIQRAAKAVSALRQRCGKWFRRGGCEDGCGHLILPWTDVCKAGATGKLIYFNYLALRHGLSAGKICRVGGMIGHRASLTHR
jgi:hypothetical protein